MTPSHPQIDTPSLTQRSLLKSVWPRRNRDLTSARGGGLRARMATGRVGAEG
jgi:hypothetical protein